VSRVLNVFSLSKSYRAWGSEWLRVAHWMGLPVAPQGVQAILHDVSFSINAGESIGIVGRNGAGKSTLLKIIAGTLAQSGGVIERNGSISAILELGMGFNPELSGRENAYHVSGLMGRTKAEIDGVIDAIAEFADIGAYFESPVRTYSSGMQARVAFAVATAFKPNLLIVDEALMVGDAKFQAKCYERISRYKSEGMAFILVSHSVTDIVRNCSRALLISGGTITMDGHPRDVTNVYLEELFGNGSRSSQPDLPGVGAAVSHADSVLDGRYEERLGYRKEEHRWGSGEAEILDFRIEADGVKYPSIIECGARVEFTFKCAFHADFDNVVPGIMIRTLDGHYLYGTNSIILNEGRHSIAVANGEVRTFRYSMEIPLNAGDYLISLGVSSGETMETLVPLDRRYDSVVISTTRKIPFTGIFDMNASLMAY